MTHTKGPWSWLPQGDANKYIIAKGCIPEGDRPKEIEGIAFVKHFSDTITTEQESNMRLMAAAPDLLEALQKCLPVIEHMARFPEYHIMFEADKSKERFEAVRNALNKAKGNELI